VNFSALDSRLLTICRTRVGSPSTNAGKSGSIRHVSSTLGAAFCDNRLAVSSINVPEIESYMLELQLACIEFGQVENVVEQFDQDLARVVGNRQLLVCCSAFSGLSRHSASMPSRPLSGVRISWLILARNAARAWAISSAVLRAASSSSLE
jgi:hypothetical protein